MITRDSVSEAYVAMLDDVLRGGTFMQVTKVRVPIDRGYVNVEEGFREKLGTFEFPDGRTGEDWLEDRMKATFDADGEYWDPLRREGQFQYVLTSLEDMLKGAMPRWNANRLLLTLFDPSKDLHESRAPTPPCLISVGFYPVRDTLTLIGTFRAQYIDAKGYGNLYSLARLLKEVSFKTGFKPLHLYNVAQKAILKYRIRVVRSFKYHLMRTTQK